MGIFLCFCSRWRGSKSSLNCIRVFKDSKSLLAGGSGNISLFDLESKTSTLSFFGHPAGVHQLCLVPNSDYFASLCHTERYIRIWTKSNKNAVATLALSNTPARMSVISSSVSGNVSLAVVTTDGTLNLFQQKLNGPVKKPQNPSCVFSIVDSGEKEAGSSRKVPILASHLLQEVEECENKVCVGFGSWLRLKFEKLQFRDLKDEVTLRRDFFSLQGKKLKKKQQLEKTGKALENGDRKEEVPLTVKHLQPGIDTSSKPEKAKKRKKDETTGEKVDEGELPMEERLSNLTLEKPGGSGIPDGNNLAHLLSQVS
jgi:hypothetical protein